MTEKPDESFTLSEAVELAMEEMGWCRHRAEWEILQAVMRGDLVPVPNPGELGGSTTVH
jgi:hypothetical protein